MRSEEYGDFIDFSTKSTRFLAEQAGARRNRLIKRIYSAIQLFTRAFQTLSLVERYIYLSIALESVYGEGQHELKYRYSNRAALLLGDDINRRKRVCSDVGRAYDKRSDILHGRLGGRIEGREVLTFNEIIRQSLLRCVSLYVQGYRNVNKALDECVHDPSKHARILRDANAFFGLHSEYKKPQELESIYSRKKKWTCP